MNHRTPTRVATLVSHGQWRVALFTLACAGLLMVAAGLYVSREYELRSMTLVARSIALAGEPAVRFNDKPAMLALIEQLAAPAQLAEVTVFDRRGTPWLHYERPRADIADAWARQLERTFVARAAIAPVDPADDALGRISLRSDGRTLLRYLTLALLSLALCAGAAALTVRAYSRRVAATLVGPIGGLATLTRAVRETRLFDRRASRVNVREIDALADDFNALLSELQSQQRMIEANQATLQHANESLRMVSQHDSLTLLPNRAYLNERVAEVIANCRAGNRRAGLAFIDSDRFKQVNDRFGHAAGDALLVELAKRLRAAVRESDFVARLGGDEFVIVITPLDDALKIEHVVRRIRRVLEPAALLPNGQHHTISVSIGVAIFPDHADTVEGLFKVADEAMYRAKFVARGSDERAPEPES